MSRIKVLVSVLLVSALSIAAAAAQIDFVEIQWPICEPSAAVFLDKISASKDSDRSRSTFYFDTANLDLNKSNAVIRTRLTGTKIKTSVKINYQDPQEIPWHYFDHGDAKCEYDFFPDRSKIGCTLLSEPNLLTAPVSADQKKLIEIEKNFYNWDGLLQYGPVESHEWTWNEKTLNTDVVVESLKAKNTLFIEFSMRVPVQQRDDYFQKTKKWLDKNKVIVCARSHSPADIINILVGTKVDETELP